MSLFAVGHSSDFLKLNPADIKADWMRTLRGARFLENSPGNYMIKYAHPGTRSTPSVLHYGLIDTIREILCGD